MAVRIFIVSTVSYWEAQVSQFGLWTS